jgi:hypothetical protein
VKRSAYERPALVISWKRRLEMGPQVGANIRDESALSRLKHGLERAPSTSAPGSQPNLGLAPGKPSRFPFSDDVSTSVPA